MYHPVLEATLSRKLVVTWRFDCYFDLIFCELAASFSTLSKLQAVIVTIISKCKFWPNFRGVALAVLYYSPVAASHLFQATRQPTQLIVVNRRTGSEAIPLRHAPFISFSTLSRQYCTTNAFFPLHDDGCYIDDTTGIKCMQDYWGCAE